MLGCSTEPIIETKGGHYLSKGELLCLRPEKWLSDRLMNTKISYLHEVGSRIWYFTTYFAALALGAITDEELSAFVVKIRRETSKRFQTNMKDCDKV